MYGLPKHVCDPRVHLNVNSIDFVCVCRKLSPHLGVFMRERESWITGV